LSRRLSLEQTVTGKWRNTDSTRQDEIRQRYIGVGVALGISLGSAIGLGLGMALGGARDLALGISLGAALGSGVGLAIGVGFGAVLANKHTKAAELPPQSHDDDP